MRLGPFYFVGGKKEWEKRVRKIVIASDGVTRPEGIKFFKLDNLDSLVSVLEEVMEEGQKLINTVSYEYYL